jgi:hypothetical protein
MTEFMAGKNKEDCCGIGDSGREIREIEGISVEPKNTGNCGAEKSK